MDPKIFIIIGVILIIILFIYILYINKRKNLIDQTIKANMFCECISVKNKQYDYVLRKDNLDIYVRLVYIPKYSQVCINSKETWRLNWNTFKTEKGKGYQNNRYLDELVNFLKKDIIQKDGSRKTLKYIILYKTCEGIVRYLNESELDVVTIKDSPYGYKVGTFANFYDDLEYIVNNLE